jgi:hypothetical protein
VLVRADLTPEQQLVQAVHAAHNAGLSFPAPKQLSVVVCRVPDEGSLRRAASRIGARGVQFTMFGEPDLDGQDTALATEPVRPDQRRIFSRYHLWRNP